jgi:predicted small integral membrane protein
MTAFWKVNILPDYTASYRCVKGRKVERNGYSYIQFLKTVAEKCIMHSGFPLTRELLLKITCG